jgi:hypothetical protein
LVPSLKGDAGSGEFRERPERLYRNLAQDQPNVRRAWTGSAEDLTWGEEPSDAALKAH